MRERYLLIDIARGIAALSILLWHYQHFYFVAPAVSVAPSMSVFPFADLLYPFYRFGFLAVPLFWVISGFVFFALYGEERKLDGWSFFVHRFSRLYPLHFATLLIVAGLQVFSMARLGQFQIYPHNEPLRFALHLAMASDWTPRLHEQFGFNQPIWSVSMEVLAYLLFFLTCRFLPRSVWTSVAIAAASAAIYMLTKNDVFKCIFYFFVGGLVHHFCIHRPILADGRLFALAALAGAAALIAVFVAVFKLRGWHPILPEAVALAFAPLLVFVLGRAERHASKTHVRRFAWIGDITYSSYLCHVPLQIVILIVWQSRGVSQPDIAGSHWFFLTYMAAIVLLAWAVYRYFERPAQNYLRERLLPRARPAAQST